MLSQGNGYSGNGEAATGMQLYRVELLNNTHEHMWLRAIQLW